MIKWNMKKLDDYTETSRDIYGHSINYKYLAENFEDIYNTTLNDGYLLPDLFENIYYLTDDGKNVLTKIDYPKCFFRNQT